MLSSVSPTNHLLPSRVSGVWKLVSFGGLIAGLFSMGCSSSSVPPTASLPSLIAPASETDVESRTGQAETDSGRTVAAHKPATIAGESENVTNAPEFPWPFQGEPRDWQSIVLHHSATATGSVESIHRAHLKKTDGRGTPWQGIGYHFVIGNGQGMADGAIEPTFRWRQQMHGAHAGVGDFNQTGIGVVLIGNFEKSNPTTAQQSAVQFLIHELCRTFAIETSRIVKHGDLKATACPGRNFSLESVLSGMAALDDSGGPPLARFVPATGISRKEALRK